MKIAVNTRMLLKDRMEGIARYIYHTTKEMVLSHPEDQFYFFFDRPYDQSFIFADNVIPITIGPPARHPFLFIIWFEYSFYNAIKKNNIDVVYSGDSYLSIRSSIPTVLVSHDLAFIHYPDHITAINRWYYNRYFKKFHQHAKKIIAVSNATKEDIILQYNIPKEKIKIAYNDTDGSFSKLSNKEILAVRKKYSNGKPYFIYLGSIHPRKNVANIIRGFDEFKKEFGTEHQLLFVGRKAWKNQEITQTYNKAVYYDEIHFLGSLDEGREKLMGAAECLLYISLFEGFGVPILEAMDAGIPIICANVSSMPEVAGKAAIQVDPNNTNDIAQAMYHIVSEDNEPLLLAAIDQRKKFNWSTSADIIYNTLKEVITDK